MGFRGPEGFQEVGGGCGYILTKFQPKRTHQTLVHTIFHDFGAFFDGLPAQAPGPPGRPRRPPSRRPAALGPRAQALGPGTHAHGPCPWVPCGPWGSVPMPMGPGGGGGPGPPQGPQGLPGAPQAPPGPLGALPNPPGRPWTEKKPETLSPNRTFKPSRAVCDRKTSKTCSRF